MRFDDRYATALRSSNLRSEEKTLHSSADILGAAGIASKNLPLALALHRMFSGDKGAIDQIVTIMTERTVSKAFHTRQKIDQVAASLIARLVLDWFRDSVCKTCGGHGFKRMDGAPTLSDQACTACGGSAKRVFEDMFPQGRVELAKWLAGELEREAALAGPAAMAALAPRLDL